LAQPPISAIEHYETFLASHYTWMSGPYDDKVAHHQALFTQLGVSPTLTGKALDLACGPGCQSIALARLGFFVTAIDANAQLLAELNQHADRLEILTVQHDLCDLSTCSALPAQVDLAICMGDIITHLPSRQCVTTLFNEVSRLLVPGGKFILGFRYLSQELHGLDRFIPVRGDNERVMTCFLEYEPDTVVVHDLIYMRQGEGWELRKSAYRKLRLSHGWVQSQLEAQGFEVLSQEQTSGVWTIVASTA
jgi:SAM-dependent methyltransferase